ncbi:MAG: hypothetical protein JWM33_1629 [Caulobacteraceae bacterium]|nr:hypothetical protein [Caulobacteraceae bacterium]
MRHRITYANAWVLRTDGAQRRMPSYVALLIALITIGVSMTGGVWLYRLISDATSPPPLLDRLIEYLCVMALYYLAAVCALAWERRDKTVQANAGPFHAVAMGALIGLAGFGVAVGASSMLGVVVPGADASSLSHRLIGLAIGAGLIGFQAYGEELFFRGWLQPVLAVRWGPWLGVCATSVIFAGAHAIGRPISPLALINDALAGAAFGFLAMRSGGLLAPFLAHFTWNWVEASWVGLTPNPGIDPLGSLFDFDLAGPVMLSGGADELNGAIATSLALVLMIGAALVWRPSRNGL